MKSLFKSFNQSLNANRALVMKTLTSAAGSGQAFNRETFEQQVTDLTIALRPEIAVLDPVQRRGKDAGVRRKTKSSAPGSAHGEAADAKIANSTYAEEKYPKKEFARKARISSFLTSTADEDIDTRQIEIENIVGDHAKDLIDSTFFGNMVSNQYEFNGIEKAISSFNRYETGATGTVPTSLDFMRQMKAHSDRRGGANHKRVWLMSPAMAQKISELQQNVRIDRDIAGARSISIPGGWVLDSYLNIPILETVLTSPYLEGPEKADHEIGVVSAGFATSGGAIADATYHFFVSPVTDNGEQLASAVASVTVVGGGGAATITLSWPDVPNAYRYRVYHGTTTNPDDARFVREISAFSYTSGSISGRVTGVTLTTDPAVAGAEVGSNRDNWRPTRPTTVGGVTTAPEMVYLWDLDRIQGMGKFEFANADASRLNFISVDYFDRSVTRQTYEELLLHTFGTIVPAKEDTSAMWRGLRVS